MTSSPYKSLDSRAFWKAGLASSDVYPPKELFRPRFPVSKSDKIFTAGSCFAQHVGRVLRENGFNVLDGEPAPDDMPLDVAQKFGYRTYSGRYGNIYTLHQLLQLLQEAYGIFSPTEPVWEKDGRFYDALRPNVEPLGLATPELVELARARHLACLRKTLEQASVLVFTLGLTESWLNQESGTVYPTAPGTIAGTYDPHKYKFHNFRMREIYDTFVEVRSLLKDKLPALRFLLTVSPVPLTATASEQHVLAATIYSKSVLRSVAGEAYLDFNDVDYFPSYEIITSHAAPKTFFESNLRNVSSEGVQNVMQTFLSAHGLAPTKKTRTKQQIRAERRARRALKSSENAAQAVCEDELLDAFSK